MRLVTLPGVFAPISDSRMLADVLRGETLTPRSRVLDVCTGSGFLAVTAAARGVRDVTAVDVSLRSVMTVRINARLNRVRIRALRGDLFEPVRDEAFDVIVSNPPYVPAPTDDLPTRGPARAWDAGRDGRQVLDRLCAEASAHLKPGGRLLITHSSLLGLDRTCDALAGHGLTVDVPVRRRGPLGPLMSGRREHLESVGLLRPGQRDEEVFVVRARKPAG